MIVSFSLSNFRSFRGEETLSLVASKKLSASHESHTVPIPDSDERVLRCAVLYGANGAGKSNLFKALRHFKELALETRAKGSGTGRTPFQLDNQATDNSSFDLQFITEGKLYRFGIVFNDQEIQEEWLIRVRGSKEIPLYERKKTDDSLQTIKRSALKAGLKLKALFTIGGPNNQSFLATAKATLDKADRGSEINAVLRWFDHTLNTIAPDEAFRPLGHTLSEDPSFLDFAGNFLKSASTGVDKLQAVKKELTEEEIRQYIPESVLSQILTSEVDPEDTGLTIVGANDGQEFVIDRKGGRHFHQIAINASHRNLKGDVVNFSLPDESDGTRRLLDLTPTLHQAKGGSTVYVIDELDRSLHPILVYSFLDFFLRTCHDGQNQMIVTTHESTLLDLELLRRDEIWFAEKDRYNATRIYSLSEYKVRNDLEIRKHYLQGRFGAIPFLGNLAGLIDKNEGCIDEQEATTTEKGLK